MSPSSLPRQALVTLTWMLYAPTIVFAGTVGPSSAGLSPQVSDMQIAYTVNTTTASAPSNLPSTIGTAVVYPLTAGAGLGQTQNILNTIRLKDAYLAQYTQSSLFDTINNSTMAYISCDSPNANISNLDASYVVTQATSFPPDRLPKAVVLYSLTQSHCQISADWSYQTFYTMTNMTDSANLVQYLSVYGSSRPSVTITNAQSSNTSLSNSPTIIPGQGQSTAVAMSVLYSITAVITVLFLVIIASGAIRAHRHPERYGPRAAGVLGRPRQSRAKGLARAMLETLPIVKFGDDEPVTTKPGIAESIELRDGAHAAPELTVGATDLENQTAYAEKNKNATTSTLNITESGMGVATATSIHSHDQEAIASAEVEGCSICTEDFEKGEDVRVLPCKHKYHPACVDPWLLNVSGTCPLCRIDLRPAAGDKNSPDGLTPPLDPVEDISNQNISTLRTIPAAQRLAALRALRDERRQQQRDVLAARGIADPDADEEDAEQHTRRHRLTTRLRDRFGVMTSSRRRESVVGQGNQSFVNVVEQPSHNTRAVAAPAAVRSESIAVEEEQGSAVAGNEQTCTHVAGFEGGTVRPG